MKVLIITYYWPPAGGSGVQRWLKFVKYLQEFGVEPVVYTVQNPSYAIEDDSLLDEVPDGITILRQPIIEPNNLVSFFNKKNTKQSAGFLNPNPSFVGKIAQYIRANYFIPDARKFWIQPSVKYLEKYLAKSKIDAVITTGPPHSVHLIGLELQQKTAIKWIADFRDPWTEIDYFEQLPLTKKAVQKHRALEKEVLQKADTVLVIGNTMKEQFQQFSKNIYVITNGFDGEVTDKIQADLDTKFSITHVGLMNADRNPKLLWKVLTDICKENIQFQKDLEVKFIGKIADEVTVSLSENPLITIQNVGYVSHQEVTVYQQKSQILLLAVNKVKNAKGIITGKIFEYLQAKRPILAIGPTDGDLSAILKTTNVGTIVNFDDEVVLKKVILDLYTSFKQGSLVSVSKNIEKFHRKELTKELSKVITKTVI